MLQGRLQNAFFTFSVMNFRCGTGTMALHKRSYVTHGYGLTLENRNEIWILAAYKYIDHNRRDVGAMFGAYIYS